MSEIVVKGCKILANGGAIQGNFSIETSPDSNVLINNKDCYFGDIKVKVPSGSTLSGATLVEDVTITIKATGENVLTDKGKALLKTDKSSGEDIGKFQAGQTTTEVPILLTISDAGQTDVIAS